MVPLVGIMFGNVIGGVTVLDLMLQDLESDLPDETV